MNEKILTFGSTIAALVASLCCLGPLILGSVGLGAALLATFAPLRPYFLTLSAALLAGGFYFAYRKPKSAQACEGQACAPKNRVGRLAKPLLWLATAVVVALAFFPSYGGKLVTTPKVAVPPAMTAFQTAELKIVGMECEVCAGVIQRKLLETPGVAQAEVLYPAGQAIVKYDPTKATPARLVEAVHTAGYKASVAN